MKQLLAGVVILFVVGIASFLYRNTVERPGITAAEPACTLEARICPDGSAVGRTGPSCAFAPCLPPNVEIPDAGIAFVLPAGYVAAEREDARSLAAFSKPSLSGTPQHAIVVHRYPIPEGKSAEDVMLENTRYQPADLAAEDLGRFEDISINGKVFRETVIERFEAMVHSAYFLTRENDVLRFDVIEHDVTGWMEPQLQVRELPEHAAFLGALRTLESAP